MRDRELVRLLILLAELEAALSKRRVKVGREAFLAAVQIIGRELSARRGRR